MATSAIAGNAGGSKIWCPITRKIPTGMGIQVFTFGYPVGSDISRAGIAVFLPWAGMFRVFLVPDPSLSKT